MQWSAVAAKLAAQLTAVTFSAYQKTQQVNCTLDNDSHYGDITNISYERTNNCFNRGFQISAGQHHTDIIWWGFLKCYDNKNEVEAKYPVLSNNK